ncbi:MAG: TIGR01777 family oxidoreductase, partial [Flammeovirgaceae bacterium]
MKKQKNKIVIPGGSGFLGISLAGYLSGAGYAVVILSRQKKNTQNGIRYEQWDGKTLGAWAKEIEGALAVINLAGRTVDCRYNQKNKAEILNSRIDSTAILGKAIQQCQTPPEVWINASSATIYRDSREQFMDEETGIIGDDFSMNVCKAWEKAFYSFELTHTRQLALRTSIVLGRHGGAFQPLRNLAKMGLGGKQGDGGQFFSWLHIDDFNRILLWLLQNPQFSGTVNCVAPHPVTNEEAMATLRKALNVPFGLNLPKWTLAIGAFFMRTETELVLKSRKVIPKRLLDQGFQFNFPTLVEAMNDLMNLSNISFFERKSVKKHSIEALFCSNSSALSKK